MNMLSKSIDLVELVVTLQDNPMGGLILIVLVGLVVLGVALVRADKSRR